MSEGVININDADFDKEVLQAQKPVLVYFWASWCGPCKLMSPAVSAAANAYADKLKVVKMEVDPNPVSVKKYQVEGVPALRLVEGDNLLASNEGVVTKDNLMSLLDNHLKS
ncbi:MAG: thioredoxin domain-containing protein [Cyanobacteria bacterium P01_D01_bin.50]